MNNKKTTFSINCYIWRKQTAEGGNNHTRFPLYSPPSADHKNNPNLAEIESNLLFHVLKCPFLKKPIPVYKLQLLALSASAIHTANCQHTAEHSGINTASAWNHRQECRESVRKGKDRNLHSYTSTQPTSAKSTSFK